MQNEHIDWASLIENMEFDHVAWKDTRGTSFFERQVLGMRSGDHDEERAESIAPEAGIK